MSQETLTLLRLDIRGGHVTYIDGPVAVDGRPLTQEEIEKQYKPYQEAGFEKVTLEEVPVADVTKLECPVCHLPAYNPPQASTNP